MTQKEKVLSYLKRYGMISPMGAFRSLTITCLAERIRDLRIDGYKIQSTIVKKNKKRYAEYRLIS